MIEYYCSLIKVSFILTPVDLLSSVLYNFVPAYIRYLLYVHVFIEYYLHLNAQTYMA